jgi:tetratricopeptide (TPR) repeat protein
VFPNLAAFGSFHLVRGNLGLALQHAQRLVDLARAAQSPSQEVYGLSFLGQCAYFGGQYGRQLEASKRALELFDPAAHAGHMFEYGFDSKVNIDAHLALCLTVTGELDAAMSVAQRVRERAQLLNIPHITYAMLFALSCMYHVRQDRDALVGISDEVRALAAAQGGSWYVWLVETQRAWAEGRADAVKGHVAMLRSFPASFCRGYWGVLAAELDAENGEFDSGLDAIDWALDNIDDGSRYILPEMQRIKARLLAGKGDDPVYREAAISAIRDAIVTAHDDGAKLFELRAALEYVQLAGKDLDLRALAVDTLRRAHDRFVEGQDHHELVAARQVLASESRREESQS